jgi:hypothetical protein
MELLDHVHSTRIGPAAVVSQRELDAVGGTARPDAAVPDGTRA